MYYCIHALLYLQVLSGAATILFTFTNVEAITSASEETKEPSRVIPSAITYTVCACSVAYFCVSTAATLSLHQFPDDTLVALPTVLQDLHIHGASTIIAIGGVLGLTASLIGSLFYLTRLVYSMANDRLLFGFLSKVSDTIHVPVYSALLTGLLSSVIALLLEFELLLQIVSIGTLLSYTVLAISVICLRYQSGMIGLYVEYEDPEDFNFIQCTDFTYADFHLDANKSNMKVPIQHAMKYNQSSSYNQHEHIPKYQNGFKNGAPKFVRKSISFDENFKRDKLISKSGDNSKPRDSTYTRLDSMISSTSNGSVSGLLRIPSDVVLEPNESTWRTAATGLLLFILCSCILSVMSLYAEFMLHLESWCILFIMFIFSILLISATVLIAKQPENRTLLYFRTPYVPFVPLLAILLNIFLMASLSVTCWIRFIIWMSLGM